MDDEPGHEDDGEIHEHSPGFFDVNGLGILSTEAFQLHSFGTVESVRRGTPGFISDDYLSAISAETTITVAELEAAGLWQRRDGGYLIAETSALSMALDFNEEMDRNAAICLSRGHHAPGEEGGGWVTCQTCLAPLKRPDGKPVGGAHGERPDYGPRLNDDLEPS